MSSIPNERRLRLRAVFDAQSAAILAVCLLLAAAGAGYAVRKLNEDEEDDEDLA